MANKRDYQPSLLWSRFIAWCVREHGADERSRPALYIYVKDRPGAYYLFGGRLYWDDDIGDGQFSNCAQDALWEERDELGEAVATGLGSLGRDVVTIAQDYDALIETLTPGPVTVTREAKQEFRPSGM